VASDSLIASARRITVLMALAQLGGQTRPVDTEDVAIKANELMPDAFSWRKYSQYIDLERVRLALKNAASAGFVVGSIRRGWMLTTKGIAAVADTDSVHNSKTDLAELARIRQAVKTSEAVRTFNQAGMDAVTARQAEQACGLNSYVRDAGLRRIMVQRVLAAVRGDQELERIMSGLVERFGYEMRGEGQ